jgi:hypothetical protein
MRQPTTTKTERKTMKTEMKTERDHVEIWVAVKTAVRKSNQLMNWEAKAFGDQFGFTNRRLEAAQQGLLNALHEAMDARDESGEMRARGKTHPKLPEGDYQLTVIDAIEVDDDFYGFKISAKVDGSEFVVTDTIAFDRKETEFRKSMGMTSVSLPLVSDIDSKDLIGKGFEAHLKNSKIAYYLPVDKGDMDCEIPILW